MDDFPKVGLKHYNNRMMLNSPSEYKPPGAYTWKLPLNAKLNKAKTPQEQNFIYIPKNYYVYQMSIKFTVY